MSRDFEVFKKEFKKWQQRFGLNGWTVHFKHEPVDRGYASLTFNLEDMTASAALDSKLPPDNVKRHAKHEALHLLIARIESNGRYRWTSEVDMIESSEELVNKLVDII